MAMNMDVALKLTAGVTGQQAVDSLRKSVEQLEGISGKISKAFGSASMALKGFITVEAVQQLKQFVSSSIDLADHLNDLSKRTGASVASLAQFKVAADNSGTSIDDVAVAMQKLSKNSVAAQAGTGSQAGAFRALGISIKDTSGQLKPANQLMLEMANKFKTFPDGAIKTALAMELMGKSGANLIPMLNDGSEAIKNFSLNIDQDFANAADAFNDKLGIIKAEMMNFGISAAKALMPALNDIADAFVGLFSKQDDMKEMFDVLAVGLKGVASIAIGLIGTIRILVSTLGALIDSAKYLKNLTSSSLTGMDFSDGRSFDDIMGDYNKRNLQILENTGKAEATLFSGNPKPENDNKPQKPDKKNTPNFNPTGAGNAEAAAKAMDSWLIKQRESIITLQQEASYIGLTTIEVEKLKDARKLDAEFAEKIKDLSPSQVAAYKQKEEAIKAQRQALLQLNYEQSHTFESGTKVAMSNYIETISDASARARKFWEDSFKGMEDALVEFVSTGKLSFSGLASSIIKDLIRIQVQQSITGPLAGLIQSFNPFSTQSAVQQSIAANPAIFAMGGIMTSKGSIPLHAYANGGVANSPQLALFGEGRRPEAYVPLPDGRRIPVALKGGGGGTNNINVTVNMGGSDQVNGSAGGTELGQRIAVAVKSILINEKRPGGILARAA